MWYILILTYAFRIPNSSCSTKSLCVTIRDEPRWVIKGRLQTVGQEAWVQILSWILSEPFQTWNYCIQLCFWPINGPLVCVGRIFLIIANQSNLAWLVSVRNLRKPHYVPLKFTLHPSTHLLSRHLYGSPEFYFIFPQICRWSRGIPGFKLDLTSGKWTFSEGSQ